MRKPRHYLVEWESRNGSRSGEWIIEKRIIAELVVRRIKELDRTGTVSMTEIPVYDSATSWEKDAWPLTAR